MTRESFDRQLSDLQDDLLTLGSMVEKAILSSVDALAHRDVQLAEQIISDDAKLDDLRYRIEEECLLLFATQQPMATDLRVIASTMIIAGELERMGDHAEGIAKICVRIGEDQLLKPLIDIPRMAQRVAELLHIVLEAFVQRDTERATWVCQQDDEIDSLYHQVFRELLTFMIEDPRTISRATYLIWVAHNIERIGDRVTNVAERIIFMATGRLERLNL